MKTKEIYLNAPTVRELIDALQKLPPDALITDSDIGAYINLHIKSEHHHWDDDGCGKPVDYDIAEFSFYSTETDY